LKTEAGQGEKKGGEQEVKGFLGIAVAIGTDLGVFLTLLVEQICTTILPPLLHSSNSKVVSDDAGWSHEYHSSNTHR
jgi:hypothetical protein